MMLISLLDWLLCAGCCYLTVPFLVEAAAGLAVSRRAITGPTRPIDIVIIMPAHNEAGILPTTLSRLAKVLVNERILLVADNCLDRTAAVARAAGVEVIERDDVSQVGKGYALAFARDHLRDSPPDIVVVLDADCFAEPEALQRLARLAHGRRTVVQAAYLMTPQPSAPPLVQISSFAFLLKNLIRQRGLQRLHLPLPLNGTGMAFPWAIFSAAPLERSSVVEDLVLTIDLLRTGIRVDFDEHCRIWSDPAGQASTLAQRQRWEGGFIATARTYAVPLILEGLRRRRLSLIYFSTHLTTPPLALLLMVQVLALASAFLLYEISSCLMPMQIVVSLIFFTVLAVMATWLIYGRKWLGFVTLCCVPLYLAWKGPIYLQALFTKSVLRWTRTERTQWTDVADEHHLSSGPATPGRANLVDGLADATEPPDALICDEI